MYRQQNKLVYNGIDGLSHINKWIQDRLNKEAIQFADGFGWALSHGEGGKKKLSSAQIRNIFGEVKKLQMKGWDDSTESSLLLLKAKLQYSAKRAGGMAFHLKDIISRGIDAVVESDNQHKSLDNFADFFEAILAYHRGYGGD